MILSNIWQIEVKIRRGRPVARIAEASGIREDNFVSSRDETSSVTENPEVVEEKIKEVDWRQGEIVKMSYEIPTEIRKEFIDLFNQYADVCSRADDDLGIVGAERRGASRIFVIFWSILVKFDSLNPKMAFIFLYGGPFLK